MSTNFRLPGPTPLPPRVLEAMQREMIPHRGPAFKALYRETLAMARDVHRTAGDVFTWPASGSAGWEAAIVNLLSPGEPVLAAICGAFGERFARIGERFGLDVRRLELPWGTAIEPAALRDALARNPDVAAVFLTHNETSTGVVNPLAELAAAARAHGALTIVDAVSSVGGLPLETDAWGLDFVFSGSQKAWMCPPGLMIAAVGPRGWAAYERARFPRFFWDLGDAKRSADQGMTPTTPPLTMIYAYHAALGLLLDEGMENVWERHRRLGEIVRAGVREAGLWLFADPAHASDTVTAVLPPEGFRAADVLAALRERGVEAQGGQGSMADALVRIGHMGWAHEPEIREAVVALQDVAAELTRREAPIPR
jgi:aspartate aminotransferase-like enzyme